MTLDFDPGDDFAAVTDQLQPVTLSRPDGGATAQVAHALRRVMTTSEARQSGGKYTAGDVAWHLPASELTTLPRLGDVIIDGQGGRWTVLVVHRATIDTRWRCVCRNLALVHGLDDFVDVEKATYTKGSGGAAEPSWKAWRTGLRARIQPAGARREDTRDRGATTRRFVVFVAEPLAVDHTHRIKGPDGTIYRVTGHAKAERIDALTEIHAVADNWPSDQA